MSATGKVLPFHEIPSLRIDRFQLDSDVGTIINLRATAPAVDVPQQPLSFDWFPSAIRCKLISIDGCSVIPLFDTHEVPALHVVRAHIYR
jgi:hypothetical protein